MGIVVGWRKVNAATAVGVEGDEVRRLMRGIARSFEGGGGGESEEGRLCREEYVALAAAEISGSEE